MLGVRRDNWWEARNLVFLAFHLILFTNLFPLSWSKSLFLIPYLFFLLGFSIDLRYLLVGMVMGGIILLLRQFPPYFSPIRTNGTYLSFLNRYLNLKELLGRRVEGLYGKRSADLIKTLVFGYKGNTYYRFRDLGVLHLVSISGFHISLLIGILRRFIGNRGVLVGIVFVYWYAIDFSIPCLRPILLLFIGKDNPYRSWSLGVIFSSLFNVYILSTVSFFLSFIFPLIFAINGERFRNRFSLGLVNCWSAFIYASLILCPLTGKFYPLAPINSLIFSILIPPLFLYLFFSWPFYFLGGLTEYISELFWSFQSGLVLNRSFGIVGWWSVDVTLCILCLIALLFLLKEAHNAKLLLFRRFWTT